MKFPILFVIVLLCTITSCTIEKTDYEAEISTVVTEYYEFKEVTSFNKDNYKISIEALNGTFYKGYNEIRLKITNTQTNQNISRAEVTFLPILTTSGQSKTSCPHQYILNYNTAEKYYTGYSVYTSESNTNRNWKLYISFIIDNTVHSVDQEITVETQNNKNLNMTEFTGSDGKYYYIALVAPQKPKIAENELVAGIYTYNQPINASGTFPDPTQFSFSKVNNYTLQLDPRMPEPSMGNHSSPNNKDLIQRDKDLYYGIVNYTMTGNWTLNFILLDQNSQTIKGDKVSTDFTPGIEGTKSSLYIDILF